MQKRKQYLIDRKFQMRLALELMVVVLLVPLVVWADFYLLGQYALAQAGAVPARGDWGLIGSLVRQQWLMMVFLYIINFGLVYLFIVFYTHRIAGPVYKFTQNLEAISGGDLSGHITLRKNDYFENLGQGINALVSRYAATFGELKSATAVLEDKARNMDDDVLKEQVEAMKKILDFYQTEAASAEVADRPAAQDDSDASGVAGDQTAS